MADTRPNFAQWGTQRGVKALAFAGEHNVAGKTVKQGKAQLLLQLFDAVAYDAGGKMQFFGGFAEAQASSDTSEIMQAA